MPIAELVRTARPRAARDRAGIEARLRELVETGEIAELRELERELVPGLVGLGRFLGLTTKRSVEIARALGVRTPEEFRAAVAAGRLRAVPGVGPKTEARVLEALARERRARRRGLLLDRARALVGAIASALDGEAAGDARRWRDACEQLAVVCAAPIRAGARALRGAAADRRGDRASERRARGLTVEGVPVELVVAAPERFGTELVRATGSAAYVAALEPLPDAPTEAGVYAALGLPWFRRSSARRRSAASRRRSSSERTSAAICIATRPGPTAASASRRWAAPLATRGYDYVAICDHTPAVGAVRGLTADDVRRQGEEIAAANERLAPFRILRGIECDILPDGRLDLPDDVLAELDWVQASVHGGQRMPRDELTRRVEEALRHPAVRCLSHPKGRIIGRRPENALDLERVFEVARRARRRARGQRPRRPARPQRRARPRGPARRRADRLLDRRALRARPREHDLAVHTARRGGATAADVLNTRPLDALLKR